MAKKNIPSNAAEIKVQGGVLNDLEIKLMGFNTSRNEEPHVNLKYYQSNYECFSEWTSEELKDFTSFLDKLGQTDWINIFKSGGSVGNKSSFGLTYHKDKKKLPTAIFIEKISPDINFFELRVNQKARVHGFRCVHTFFLVWLDRNHQIYPQ